MRECPEAQRQVAWNHGRSGVAAVGDELLIVVAQAIWRALRDGDVLARIGGDEFVAFTFDADEASARAVAERMLGFVHAAHTVGLQPHVSLGVACGSQRDDTTLVLRQADTALYEAKCHGGGRSEIAVIDAKGANPVFR